MGRPATDGPPREPGVARVSTLELFFDLVFVFTVTQAAHLVEQAHGAGDFLRALLVLAVVWWMYGGYAWLTSNVGTGRTSHRLLLLAGMAGFLVMALRIPAVAGRHGAAFGLAYLVVVLAHAVLFARAREVSTRALRAVLGFNLALAALALVSGFLPARWNLLAWIAAGGAIVAATVRRSERGFDVTPSHFVERHGLVILIALGESVTAVGAGAAALPVGRGIAAAALGLALAAALWWSYFDRDDARAEHALAHAAPERRARLALLAYYHAHLAMLAGIILAAAGVRGMIAGLATPAARSAWLLSAGVALYLAGEAAFRRLLRIGPVGVRLAAAAAALLAGLAGTARGGVWQLAALLGLLTVMLVAERRTSGR